MRDALNLTYDVTLEVSLFNRLDVGWWLIHVTSRPASISEAVAASLRVLRNVATSRIRASELARAKRAVLTRMDSESKVGRLVGHGFLLCLNPCKQGLCHWTLACSTPESWESAWAR